MGREIKRVPLDFDWPLNKVWEGFLIPESLHETKCPDCEIGYGPEASLLYKQWYGNAPFSPSDTGSTPFTTDVPAIRAFAEKNVERAEWYYGFGEAAVQKEAERLTTLWNGAWSHHLSQEDVDALVDGGRLWDFTHTWSKETGWQKIEPTPVVPAEEVNLWSLSGFGHDSINCGIVIRARLAREGKSDACPTCKGHGSIEVYPGQREEAEKWYEDTDSHEPPTGEGWQVWETVSEGSPISPVFADREGLINWLMSPAYNWGTSKPLTREQAENFTESAWAPTMMFSTETGVINGDQFVAKEGE